VQLKSFRDQRLNGPAVSDVVPTWPTTDPERLPTQAFSLDVEAERRCSAMTSTPYAFRPERGLSEAMFFDAILKALPSVLPVLGSLFGGGGKEGAGGGALDGVLKAIGSPEIQDLVKQLLGQLATAKSRASSQSLSFAASTGDGRSQAMIAPALLAALPSLMPMLQNVLSPETIKAVLSSADPSKVIGAVTSGLKDLAGVGIENQKLIYDQLKAIHPSLDDPGLMNLLGSMSLSARAREEERPSFKRAGKVRVTLLDVEPSAIEGQSAVLYRLGGTLRFPFAVETPKPIRSAQIDVVLRELESHAVLAKKRAKVAIDASGPVARVPSFDADALARIEPGTDCALTITVTWAGASGQRLGSSVTQWVKLVRGATIIGAERAGEAKPLDDVTRHREFWHKVWEGPFDEARRRFDLQLKYCYRIEPGAAENSRMEAKALLEEPDIGRSTGKLKSGLLLSAAALNSLLPRLFERTALAREELEAFDGREAAERFATCAQARVQLSGKSRGSAAIWVFPEVAVHEVTLGVVDGVNDNGQVLSTEERKVTFPLPVAAHFVGTRSGQ
jgi:hypothetical protein